MADTPKTEDIVKMSVPDAKAILPSLTDEQLGELKTLETNDGENEGRVTLLAAIEAEQARRVASAGTGTGGDTGGEQTPPVTDAASQRTDQHLMLDLQYELDATARALSEREAMLTAIGEAIGSAAYDDLATGVVVIDRVGDLVIAKLAELKDVKAEADAMRARIIELEQTASLGNAPTGAPVADYRHIATRERGYVLVLMDGPDKVRSLGPILTGPEEFRQHGADTVVYDRPIVLPITAPAFRLTAVVLVDDDGTAIDRCSMVPAMEAGGGRSVEIPAGTLLFRQPARSAAEAERAAGDAKVQA